LTNLGATLDEAGDRRAAIDRGRQALRLFDARAPEALSARVCLRNLAVLLLESKGPRAEEEAKGLLRRAERIDERVRSLPRDPVAHPEAEKEPVRPEAR